ncbi:PepSY domain-containing protein [Halopseudomonas salegens]|uniref:Peptidase propeptide and YPEB domain-containing protein n=1 Tax=Halopseudomonas salegens TaxID=1434072 RepID=A0A1H2FML3_9GAMM|nr:PepSY domain-containing protein [Halopseudomonas salegens]SDU08559.1 Peptidase propeptide and YPEB domain-containing protein [Halopseudomonas salegens]
MKKLIAISCITGLTLTSASAFADNISTEKTTLLVEQGIIMPLETLEEKALAIKPGQITDRDLEQDDGRYEYELDIRQEDGRKWDITLDASSGEAIKIELDD